MNKLPIFKFCLNEGLDEKFLPTRAHEDDTGWDVRSAVDLIVKPGQYIKIPLGFRTFAPKGWWLELKPRSSTFTKKHLHALYGTIDESYIGEMIWASQYLNEYYYDDYSGPALNVHNLEIKAGDAIGQLVPVRRQEMLIERVSDEEFEKMCKERNSSRGTGGFGSTG